MRYIKRITVLASLMILFIPFTVMSRELPIVRELPILVDVSDLGREYDNKRVAVMGWAQSVEVLRGRLGSTFFK